MSDKNNIDTEWLGQVGVYEQDDFKVNSHNFKDKRQNIKMTLQCIGPMLGWYALKYDFEQWPK